MTEFPVFADRLMERNGRLVIVRLGVESSAVFQRKTKCTRTERAFHWERQERQGLRYKEFWMSFREIGLAMATIFLLVIAIIFAKPFVLKLELINCRVSNITPGDHILFFSKLVKHIWPLVSSATGIATLIFIIRKY